MIVMFELLFLAYDLLVMCNLLMGNKLFSLTFVLYV